MSAGFARETVVGMGVGMPVCKDCPIKKQVIEGLKLIAAGKGKIEKAIAQ